MIPTIECKTMVEVAYPTAHSTFGIAKPKLSTCLGQPTP